MWGHDKEEDVKTLLGYPTVAQGKLNASKDIGDRGSI